MGEVVPARTSPTLHPPSPPPEHQLSWLALQEIKMFINIVPFSFVITGNRGVKSCTITDSSTSTCTNNDFHYYKDFKSYFNTFIYKLLPEDFSSIVRMNTVHICIVWFSWLYVLCSYLAGFVYCHLDSIDGGMRSRSDSCTICQVCHIFVFPQLGSVDALCEASLFTNQGPSPLLHVTCGLSGTIACLHPVRTTTMWMNMDMMNPALVKGCSLERQKVANLVSDHFRKGNLQHRSFS